MILFIILVNIGWISILKRKIKPKTIAKEIHKHVNTKFYNRNFDKNNFLSKVTIVTQISEERLDRLEILSNLYSGPISCTLFRKKFEKLNVTMKWLEENHPKILQNVDLHIVVTEKMVRYPVNLLRNIAWEAVKTPFVFILDIDFIPSENFENELIKISKTEWFNLIKENKAVLAIQTFHWKCNCPPTYCKTRNFYDQCRRGKPLLSNHPAQRATNISKWSKTTELYEVQYQILYEPYTIGNVNMTKFDPIFDYGNDKVSHMYELTAQKKRIFVLPNAFVGHLDHIYGIHKTALQHAGGQAGWYHFDIFERRVRRQYKFNFFCENMKNELSMIPECLCSVRTCHY
eukprot:gene1153-10667_t